MNVNNTTSIQDKLHDISPFSIFVGIILLFIIFMTVFGNILVLLAVYKDRSLRHTTNFFIVNLACADLCLGISVLPFSAALEVLGYWPFGPVVCVIWTSVDVLWCTGSIITLCVISVDRYIGVTRPLRHSFIMSEGKVYWIIVVVWVLSVAISIGPLLGWKADNNRPNECQVNEEPAYVIFSVMGSFYIPMFIIVFVYIRIYKKATQHTANLAKGESTSKNEKTSSTKIKLRVHTGRSNSSGYTSPSLCHSVQKMPTRSNLAGKISKFNKEKKAAKTLGIVVGVFILCWFPFFFCLPLGALCSSCVIPDELFKTIFWLGYCNSMMNPVIYGFSSKEFKRAFRQILRCKYGSERLRESQRSSMYDVCRPYSHSRSSGNSLNVDMKILISESDIKNGYNDIHHKHKYESTECLSTSLTSSLKNTFDQTALKASSSFTTEDSSNGSLFEKGIEEYGKLTLKEQTL